jgi:hypothetical protein
MSLTAEQLRAAAYKAGFNPHFIVLDKTGEEEKFALAVPYFGSMEVIRRKYAKLLEILNEFQ